MSNSSVLLASGGLDSTTLAYLLMEKGVNFIPVFIDYGQHCSETELLTLRSVLPNQLEEKIVCLDISDVYSGSYSRLIQEPDLWKDNVKYQELYLPYRNLLLLTVGAAYAQSHNHATVYSAFINSNHALELDCSADFFSKLFSLLGVYGSVEMLMPFRDFSKYQVALEGIRLKAPIARTFSCQVSSKVPCGACPNCVDRLNALSQISHSE